MERSRTKHGAGNSIPQSEDQELGIAQIRTLTMDPSLLEERTINVNIRKLLKNKKACIRKPAKASLGALDLLPVEILQMSILELDLLSLAQFRQTNRRARQITDLIPQYEIITTHAPDALPSIIAVKMGHLITCQALYDKLCTAECETCGNLASYLYILRFTRVCFPCFTERPEYHPVKSSYAMHAYGLNREKFNTLPRLKSIPGKYALKPHTSPRELVDKGVALNAGLELHGTSEGIKRYADEQFARKRCEYKGLFEWAKAEGRNPIMRRPYVPRKPADTKEMNPERFMAVINMPWYNTATRESVWGFYCRACDQPSAEPPYFWRRYTVDSFREHVKKFGRIVDNKHVAG